MGLVLFFVTSMIIVSLFSLNKMRVARLQVGNLLNWIKWYALFLALYYLLSSSTYPKDLTPPIPNEAVNLSVLVVISFGMIIYVNQYCEDMIKERKLKEIALAYATFLEEEMNSQNAQLNSNEKSE
ncbi:MAG TPA: hypothetical protein DCY20_04660 [Firmicutes bacterium]|nr:hypothetical protein [Bacillota bacterium]